jgi:hypothetical protein
MSSRGVTMGSSAQHLSLSTALGRTAPAAICGSQLPMPNMATGITSDRNSLLAGMGMGCREFAKLCEIWLFSDCHAT